MLVKVLTTLAFLLLPGVAWAQCTGNFPANTVCGTVTGGVPKPIANTSAVSVSNADGTLTISPTTGAITAGISLAHQNTWTTSQTFSGPLISTGTLSIAVTGSTQCLHANSSGLVSGTGSDCGAGGGGAVSSVSAADGSLTISPTTGAVTAAISPGFANTWTGSQFYTATVSTAAAVVSSLITSGTTCVQADSSGRLSSFGSSCAGGGGGAVNSVTNTDGSLIVTPTIGAVITSLAVAHPNNWTATQTVTPSVLIGTITANVSPAALEIDENPNIRDHITGLAFGAHADPGSFTLSKTRGATPGTNTVLQTGDSIGKLRFLGADGANYQIAGAVLGAVDAAPSAGHVPGRLVFQTASGTGNTDAMWINSNQDAILGAAVSTTDNGARLHLYPATSTTSLGYWVEHTAHGTVTGGGNCPACFDSLQALNVISVDSDDANIVSPLPGLAALAIGVKWGGANAHGERGPLYVSSVQTAADASASNPFGHNNVAATFVGYSNVNVGGTNISPVGANFAMNPKCHLGGSATDWERNFCAEVDVEADLGATVDKQGGWLIYEGSNHHSQGVTYDFAYGFSGTGVGFFCGFCATDVYGNGVTGPLNSSSIFIGTEFKTGGPYVLGTGIDLRGWNMTTTMITQNFKIGGAGQVFAPGYNIFGGAAGVSCPAGTVNAATVAFTGGIATHC